MLMICLGNVDFNTYAGGTDRTVDASVVWVKEGTDVTTAETGIDRFLWNDITTAAQYPIPLMVTHPTRIPVVGVPTSFTFKWIDPVDNTIVAEGPFDGSATGGPYRELESNGFIIQARARKIRIDPNQPNMPAFECSTTPSWNEDKEPNKQGPDACTYTFNRSSANAEERATKDYPKGSAIEDAFYATVEVTWDVVYGTDPDNLTPLTTGLTMRLSQAIPVQEVQVPNQPPPVAIIR